MWNHLRKPLFALSLGLNLAFVAMWLVSSPPARPGGHDVSNATVGPSSVASFFIHDVGVTEAQWKKIAPIVSVFQQKAGKQRQEIRSLRAQMLDLLTAPEADEAAIRSKQEEILAGQRRMQNLVIDQLLKEKKILSPEQERRLMQILCEQCRNESGIGPGKSLGRLLDEKSGSGMPDKVNMESR